MALIIPLITSCLILWLVCLPREWTRRLERGEQRVAFWFIGLRFAMPLVWRIANQFLRFAAGGWDADAYFTRATQVMNDLDTMGHSISHLRSPGTGSVDLLLGYFFHFGGGSSRTVGDLLFTFIGTVGILLFWLSSRDLVPKYRPQFAAVMLFSPTLIFWSAAISKEAPMLLGLGLAMNGLYCLRVSARPLRGSVAFASGVLLMGLFRPHIALLVVVSIVLASLTERRRAGVRLSSGRSIIAGFGLVATLVLVPLAATALDASSNNQLLDRAYQVAESTSKGQGRSSYAANPTRSPLDVPKALSIVLLRPYPWEVRTGAQLLASAEIMALLATLVIFARRRGGVRAAGRAAFSSFHSRMAIFYSVMFSAAVVSYGNIGLIVRQRMQVWGFLVLLIFSLMSPVSEPTSQRLIRSVSRT